MFVAGVDACRADPGWVCFKVDLESHDTTVELIDLTEILKCRPVGLACAAIDIPIGLLDRARTCDLEARKRLGRPRCYSVFRPPCRAALAAISFAEANAINRQETNKGLSQQAWGIAKKIKQVDDAILPECQEWAFEVHPEVSFWAMNNHHPMSYKKKSREGQQERISLLERTFPLIRQGNLDALPLRVGLDDVLDAAAAAWTGLRRLRGDAEMACPPEIDDKMLSVTIFY